MNCTKGIPQTFRKSLTIGLPKGIVREQAVTLHIKASGSNPHWHESVDKWAKEWVCIIRKNRSLFGVYGPIDPNTGKNLAEGVYVVEYSECSGFELETRRITDIEVIDFDSPRRK